MMNKCVIAHEKVIFNDIQSIYDTTKNIATRAGFRIDSLIEIAIIRYISILLVVEPACGMGIFCPMGITVHKAITETYRNIIRHPYFSSLI